MASEPTPGEFRLSADGLSVYAMQTNGRIRLTTRVTSAYREGPNAPPLEELRANARLFFASKVMLAALDPDTLDAIADEIQCFEHSARAGSLRILARKARAAIKLATEPTS